MASMGNEEELMRHLRKLEYENAQLRIQCEITELEQQLNNRIEQDPGTTHVIPHRRSILPQSSTPRFEAGRNRMFTPRFDQREVSGSPVNSRSCLMKPATYE